MKKIFFTIIVVLFITNTVHATTVEISDHICPICKTKNSFKHIMSSVRSQYDLHQFIKWEYSQTWNINCCLHCFYATFNDDFDSIPLNKIDNVRAYLKTVKFDQKYKDYEDIPASKKLEIAENVYRIWGKDYNFWCSFYRVIAYHYDIEGQKNLAFKARFKTLLYAHLLLADKRNKGKEKELLYIIATMNYFTGQEKNALMYLNKAEKYKFENPDVQQEYWEAIDKTLTNFITSYPDFIEENKRTGRIKDNL